MDESPSGYLILGATGSVGSALARRLAKTGASLVLAARDEASLAQLGQELSATTLQVDACESGSIDSCVEQSAAALGNLAGIANCIGSILLKPAHLTTDAEWDDTIATNLTSCFAVTRAAGKAMRSTGGSVVFVSSAAAAVGTPNHEAIASAKAGIEGLLRSAAATYANRGIRFNGVAPGLVKSKMTTKLWESEAAASQSSEMHPLGRLGEPDEIAAAIEWLLLPENSWTTGQVLSVDGGLANVLPRRTVRA